MNVFKTNPLGSAVVLVAGKAVIVGGVQVGDRGVLRGSDRRGGPNPGQPVVDAVFIVQCVQVDLKFVFFANTPTVRCGNSAF